MNSLVIPSSSSLPSPASFHICFSTLAQVGWDSLRQFLTTRKNAVAPNMEKCLTFTHSNPTTLHTHTHHTTYTHAYHTRYMHTHTRSNKHYTTHMHTHMQTTPHTCTHPYTPSHAPHIPHTCTHIHAHINTTQHTCTHTI